MKYIAFDNNAEIQEAEFYLEVKGVSFHKKIMTHLGFDFAKKEPTINWSKVSALLRYDKKLRDKIYIYLATFEEYVRAYISNKYEDYPIKKFWKNGKSERSKAKN